jgi:hypothetical protein
MSQSRNEPTVGFIPFGGLGNQLFQFATALSLRNERDRYLAIDLFGKCRTNTKGMPEIFDFEIEKISPIIIRNTGASSLIKLAIELLLKFSNKSFYSESLNHCFTIFQRIFSQLTSLIVGVKVVSPRGLGWDEKLKPNHYDYTLLGNFHSYLFISRKVSAELKRKLKSRDSSKLINDFKKLAIDEKPVAIHIRLGDYLSLSELNIVNNEYFARAIEMIESYEPGSNYWIFTNDQVLARQYLPSDLIGRLRFIPESLNSAQTMELMWLCHRYIISNSTFSWWGAFLSVCDKPLVIAPKKWFKNLDEPLSICPPEWVRL